VSKTQQIKRIPINTQLINKETWDRCALVEDKGDKLRVTTGHEILIVPRDSVAIITDRKCSHCYGSGREVKETPVE